MSASPYEAYNEEDGDRTHFTIPNNKYEFLVALATLRDFLLSKEGRKEINSKQMKINNLINLK